jgi:ABC-type uncharacterized transport system substrate-binding protein
MKNSTANLLKLFVAIAIVVTIVFILDRKSPTGEEQLMKLALVQYNDSPLSEMTREGIEKGLMMEGLRKDTDYVMNVYNAQGDVSTLNLIFDGVLNDNPRLVFVTSTPTLQVAVQKIKEIPVVFSTVADPVAAGVGSSYDDHLPNVTGISTLGDYEGMVNLVKAIIPGVKSIGTLFSPGELNSVRNMNYFKEHAETAGIELITVPVNSSSESADAALSLVARKPEVVCQIIDNLTSLSAATIIRTCREHQVPVFGFVSDQSEKGAILVVSRDYVQAGIDAVRLAKKIFDGANPAEIPFEFVSRTEILINSVAARENGITIPEEILNRENTVIIQ